MQEWELNSKLCFVQGNWAYFTTLPVAEQWGDDWNDAPYEHNAGQPYHDNKDPNDPMWFITKVAFDADLETPDAGHLNSPYSVWDINSGAVAWLRSPGYAKNFTSILAGTTLLDFISLIRRAGGHTYLKVI